MNCSFCRAKILFRFLEDGFSKQDGHSKIELRLPVRFLVLSWLSLNLSCSTFAEITSDKDSSSGYQKTTNAKGETVYQRTRVDPSFSSTTHESPYYIPPPPVLSQPPENTVSVSSPKDSGSHAASRGYFPLEISKGQQNTHVGIGIGYELFPVLDLKGGVALFTGSEVYAGFDLSSRLKYKIGVVAPFVGVGGYIGDIKRCSTDGILETCEKKFLSAGYTEFGISIIQFSFYIRNYNIDDAGKKVPDSQFYGLGFNIGL